VTVYCAALLVLPIVKGRRKGCQLAIILISEVLYVKQACDQVFIIVATCLQRLSDWVGQVTPCALDKYSECMHYYVPCSPPGLVERNRVVSVLYLPNGSA